MLLPPFLGCINVQVCPSQCHPTRSLCQQDQHRSCSGERSRGVFLFPSKGEGMPVWCLCPVLGIQTTRAVSAWGWGVETWLCRDQIPSQIPSQLCLPQDLDTTEEQAGSGTGSSLLAGIQKCRRSWNEHRATSSPCWRDLQTKPALMKAVPESSHFTCGHGWGPAGCTAHPPARPGAGRGKKGEMSQNCTCPALGGRAGSAFVKVLFTQG